VSDWLLLESSRLAVIKRTLNAAQDASPGACPPYKAFAAVQLRARWTCGPSIDPNAGLPVRGEGHRAAEEKVTKATSKNCQLGVSWSRGAW
jgi:hypothetical protein